MSGPKIVYTSETGKPSTGKKPAKTTSPSRSTHDTGASHLPAAQTQLIVRKEKTGRKGKTVSIVEGFNADKTSLTPLAKRLKAICGTGGTAKDSLIELQGDHRAKLASALEKMGYTVRRGN